MLVKDYAIKGVTVPSLESGLGFVILALPGTLSEVKITINYIRTLFDGPHIRIATSRSGVERYKSLGCPIDIATKTITELVNLSVSKSVYDWNLVLVSGSKIKKNLIKKYLYFCRRDEDFIYPVVNRKWLFSEASINGMMYNKKFIPVAPELETDMPVAKAAWGTEIVRAGGQLKAIVGASF